MSATSFRLKTTAFKPGSLIPRKFTCEGENTSPPLTWTGTPHGTESLALVTDDPDAPGGTWVHWVIYNLPPTTHGLPEDVPKDDALAAGGLQGVNDFGKVGYGGPCPPPGKAHRYFFKIYALNSILNLRSRATKGDLDRAMQGHILGQAEIMGRYQR